MIAEPVNDRACLEKMTELAREATKRDDVRSLVPRFNSTRALAAWIRSLPQRDDNGEETEGPRITCDVSQRVRIGADDPNCVERSLLYLALAELLDAQAIRALATIDTPAGRHTFPVENGRPVVLDPNVRRNQLAAGLWLMQPSAQRNASAVSANPVELLAWLAEIADEPAFDLHGAGGRERVVRGRVALGRVVNGAQLDDGQAEDVLYLLDRATEASELYGRAGRYGAQLARAALERVGVGARRNVCACTRNIKIGRYNVRPDWKKIGEVATTSGYVGGKVALTAYGGPLAGSLWDPAFQAATGKTSQQALAPLGPLAPVANTVTTIATSSAASSTVPPSGTLQSSAPPSTSAPFVTLAAFYPRR